MHLVPDQGKIAVFCSADVNDVVDLVCAITDGLLRFKHLGFHAVLPKREADGCAHVHRRAGQQFLAQCNRRRVDGHHFEPVFTAFRTQLFKIRAPCVGVQLGVVEQVGQACGGELRN